MAGYCGFSMSNNAVTAYELGMAPRSKWTKKMMAEAFQTSELYDGKDELRAALLKLIAKTPAKVLRETFLECAEWHHTGSWFNRTDFYGVREFDNIQEAEDAIKAVKPAEKVERRYVHAKFVEWSGSRNYPVRNDVECDGYIEGNWFHSLDGFYKKKVTGKWFQVTGEEK